MPRLLRTSLDTIKEKGFTLRKARSRRYPAQTVTDADYADDLALLADIPAQAESLLHSLEEAAKNIGLYVNSDKTEFMSFKKMIVYLGLIIINLKSFHFV